MLMMKLKNKFMHEVSNIVMGQQDDLPNVL